MEYRNLNYVLDAIRNADSDTLASVAAGSVLVNPHANKEGRASSKFSTIGRIGIAHPRGEYDEAALVKAVNGKAIAAIQFLSGRRGSARDVPMSDALTLLAYYTLLNETIDRIWQDSRAGFDGLEKGFGLWVDELAGAFSTLSEPNLSAKEIAVIGALDNCEDVVLKLPAVTSSNSRFSSKYIVAARTVAIAKLLSLQVLRANVWFTQNWITGTWSPSAARSFTPPSLWEMALIRCRETGKTLPLGQLNKHVAWVPNQLFYWDVKFSDPSQVLAGGPVLGHGSQGLSRTKGRCQLYSLAKRSVIAYLAGDELSPFRQQALSRLSTGCDYDGQTLTAYLKGLPLSIVAMAIEPDVLQCAITLATKVINVCNKNAAYSALAWCPRQSDVAKIASIGKEGGALDVIPYYTIHKNFAAPFTLNQNPAIVTANGESYVQTVTSSRNGCSVSRKTKAGKELPMSWPERSDGYFIKSVFEPVFTCLGDQMKDATFTNEALRALVGLDGGPVSLLILMLSAVHAAPQGDSFDRTAFSSAQAEAANLANRTALSEIIAKMSDYVPGGPVTVDLALRPLIKSLDLEALVGLLTLSRLIRKDKRGESIMTDDSVVHISQGGRHKFVGSISGIKYRNVATRQSPFTVANRLRRDVADDEESAWSDTTITEFMAARRLL